MFQTLRELLAAEDIIAKNRIRVGDAVTVPEYIPLAVEWRFKRWNADEESYAIEAMPERTLEERTVKDAAWERWKASRVPYLVTRDGGAWPLNLLVNIGGNYIWKRIRESSAAAGGNPDTTVLFNNANSRLGVGDALTSGDGSGWAQSSGSTAIGATSLVVLTDSTFPTGGGSVAVSTQSDFITYTAYNHGTKTFTGIPASGAGSITATIPASTYVITAPAVTDTDLKAATNKLRKAMDTSFPLINGETVATTTAINRQMIWRSTFAASDANFEWKEFAVFNAASGDVMLDRVASDQGRKANTSGGQVWELTLTATLA